MQEAATEAGATRPEEEKAEQAARPEEERQEGEPYKSGIVQCIDSRELAGIVGKSHKDLLRDIRRYCKQAESASQSNPKRNFALSDFFIESSYAAEGQNRRYQCFLVTKKGCEFIAHKLTGEKGTAFSMAYINRFHEMEAAMRGSGWEAEAFRELSERVDGIERAIAGGPGDEPSENPFSAGGKDVGGRLKRLNDLAGRVSELYGMDKNRVLHYMYCTIQDQMGVRLNPYLTVMKAETGNDGLRTLHVVASVDRFYEAAVKMSLDAIGRKGACA